jgi:ribosomal protein L37AE/L43A
MATKKVTAKTTVKAEVKPVVKPEPKKESKPEIDGLNNERCSKCLTQIAARLDAFTWRCPVCGDYEAK